MTTSNTREADTRGTRIAFALIRQAAVSTTHQAMVFDAVGQLESDQAAAWRRLLFRHAQTLALGAEAPDADFRDFKNHLLFPGDNSSGGATGKARCWYRNLVTALTKREWQNAAYCAGVLSHYIADALHPFHTAQSAADNDVYAALDLSVLVTYRRLAAMGGVTCAPVMLGAGADFLDAAMRAGAVEAGAQYASLLSHFDLARAAANPAAGLDDVGEVAMAAVIGRATALIASVFSRAIAEASQPAPMVVLTTGASAAVIGAPFAALSNWSHKRAWRRLVRVMARELATNGRVSTLPEEVRIKRDLMSMDIPGQPGIGGGRNVVAFKSQRASVSQECDEQRAGNIIVLSRQKRHIEVPRPAPAYIEPEPMRRRNEVLSGNDAGRANS